MNSDLRDAIKESHDKMQQHMVGLMTERSDKEEGSSPKWRRGASWEVSNISEGVNAEVQSKITSLETMILDNHVEVVEEIGQIATRQNSMLEKQDELQEQLRVLSQQIGLLTAAVKGDTLL